MPDSGSGVWKWIAAILATAMIAGFPGYLDLYVGHPSKQEIEFIRGRQDTVLQRLAGIDIRLQNHETTDADLRSLIDELRRLILQGSGDGVQPTR